MDHDIMIVQSTRRDHDGRRAARVLALALGILFIVIFVLHSLTF